MKSIINKQKKEKLIFKCTDCGETFVSDEYKKGLMLPSHGYYPSATDECPMCDSSIKGGEIHLPSNN